MSSRNSDPSSPEGAWQYALRLLAARDYTVAALTGKLRSRGFSDEAAEHAVKRLEDEHWISDRRFAERFAESAISTGRFYGHRLRLEMRRRGVPADLIDETLARIDDEHDEGAELRSLCERHFPGFSLLAASDREKRKVVGFLQRRGFRLSAIFGLLRK